VATRLFVASAGGDFTRQTMLGKIREKLKEFSQIQLKLEFHLEVPQ